MRIRSKLLEGTWVAIFSFVLLAVLSPLVYAQSSSTISQSFKTGSVNDDIVSGALVNTKINGNTIELATLSTANRLVGIVDSNSLVSISEGGQEVKVVLSGTTNVLVSDINGTVKSGDKITTSPIAGVGMKATLDGQIVGTAQDSFRPATTRSVTDRDGKRHDVRLGYVSAQIGITAYQVPGSNFLPPFIQSTANSIAGQPVSLVRILVCSVLLILGFLTVFLLVYTSVRSAITSLGRNPLAARAIRRSLYQIGAISLVAIGVTLLASYLILTV